MPVCHMAERTITMYPKSFLALNNAGRLTGARTALRFPDERYTCHHYGSILVLQADAERPWFAHTDAALTERGTQNCPYVHPAPAEVRFIRKLRRYVHNAKPVVIHASQCASEYHSYEDEEVICS
ncbi:putative zinc ribbon protein [Citrobacter amalonaticus]